MASSTPSSVVAAACSSAARSRSCAAGDGSPQTERSRGDGQVLHGRAVVLATGSVPRSIHGFDVDGEQIVTSRASSLPERVAVIGGGVIGVEFASVSTDVGSTVALLAGEPGGVLPVGPDPELSRVLDAALRRRGTRIVGGARVSPPERSRGGIVLGFESPAGSDKIEVDQVLVAVGRRPATDDLGLADAGVRVDGRGFVEVDGIHAGDPRAPQPLREGGAHGLERVELRSACWRTCRSGPVGPCISVCPMARM